MADRIRRLGSLGCLSIIAFGCSAHGPSEANLALNTAVLADVPLPSGTAQIGRTEERHDVEGRFCIDLTRVTLRAPSADPSTIVPFLERELTPEGWAVVHRDLSGSGDPDLFGVTFEKGDASVGATNEGSDFGQYVLVSWKVEAPWIWVGHRWAPWVMAAQ